VHDVPRPSISEKSSAADDEHQAEEHPGRNEEAWRVFEVPIEQLARPARSAIIRSDRRISALKAACTVPT
jgi:hypothetical protein